ncbi:SEMA4D, partial [Cervus elaphus hippelaphus]
MRCTPDDFSSEPSLFSVLCLAASSPLPFPPPGSSSLSCLGPDSSSSPRSPWPASGPGPDSHLQVTLLPPFLSDQAQHVHALGTFHLFCQATGEQGTCPDSWGKCINREARAANFSSSLNLPDKTLQFVKDHPLMDESVTPIDSRPRLIKGDVNYTQIVVDRTRALDGTIHDVMFVST